MRLSIRTLNEHHMYFGAYLRTEMRDDYTAVIGYRGKTLAMYWNPDIVQIEYRWELPNIPPSPLTVVFDDIADKKEYRA